MEELASTVSDILNQAAGGVGDISEWLASDGLPGYAAVETAQAGFMVALGIVMVAVSACAMVAIVLADGKGTIDFDPGYAYLPLTVILICSLVMIAVNAYSLVGWLVSPDGMLLETLVSALGN